MNCRRALLFLYVLLLGTGLNIRPLVAAPAVEPVARVHWLGLKQICTDSNSAHFMAVWQLPQTTALVAQTLDKISRLPNPGVTNAAAFLRPLLDDLVTNEFYLEVTDPANSTLNIQPSTLLLAIRLPANRAQLWQTNLTAALPAAEISQSGEWTLIGLGLGTQGSPADFATRVTALDPQFLSRIPHPASPPLWLEADFNPSRLAAACSRSAGGEVDDSVKQFSITQLLAPIAHLHLTFAGEAGAVRTRATADFFQPLNLTLPPWEIPTNLIGQTITSFTAVRGLAPWLATLPVWQGLQLTNPPNQLFFWAHPGVPFMSYFTAPLPEATNQLVQLAARLVQNVNPWLATNNYMGRIQWQTNPPVLIWRHAFIISPFLAPASFNHQDYVFGGLYPLPSGDASPPPAALRDPQLVYYQNEQAGERLNAGLFISQTFRMVFHKPQLSAAAAALVWVNKIWPMLGDSTTAVRATSPTRLVLARQSTLGFTALELQLMADWLESPQFPYGLHTFRAAPDQ